MSDDSVLAYCPCGASIGTDGSEGPDYLRVSTATGECLWHTDCHSQAEKYFDAVTRARMDEEYQLDRLAASKRVVATIDQVFDDVPEAALSLRDLGWIRAWTLDHIESAEVALGRDPAEAQEATWQRMTADAPAQADEADEEVTDERAF